MRPAKLLLVAAPVLAVVAAHRPAPAAEPSAKPPAAPKVQTRASPAPPKRRPKPAPAPHAPPPQVVLTVDAPTNRGPWSLHVANQGPVPVRLAADARWLTLDVTPRGAPRPVRCELPADMRPDDELESDLVVPPGRAYAESFEPRLYCFGAKLDALAPGAMVVARLGWTGGPPSAPPFAVAPIDGVEPAVSSLKVIDGLPIALPDDPTPAPEPAPAPTGSAAATESEARLALTGTPTIDSVAPESIEITLTLRNQGTEPAIVRLRPETLAFDVIAPDSVQTCVWPTVPGAPLREAYTRLGPHGSASLSVLLSAYCSGHALDQAGLYVVTPRLDTRRASGASIGYRTFDDLVVAATPTIVRLRRGNAPRSLRRPRLEPP
jgi:hypothetical protein